MVLFLQPQWHFASHLAYVIFILSGCILSAFHTPSAPLFIPFILLIYPLFHPRLFVFHSYYPFAPNSHIHPPHQRSFPRMCFTRASPHPRSRILNISLGKFIGSRGVILVYKNGEFPQIFLRSYILEVGIPRNIYTAPSFVVVYRYVLRMG